MGIKKTTTDYRFFILRQCDVLKLTELLTGAAESLLPESNQHVETQVTVGRLVEVLQSPHMLPVVFYILQKRNK